MATVRRGQWPMTLDLPSNQPDHLPPICALFLIYFDTRAGYTIAWKRSLPAIELEGVVEYKSLPSGLHTVKEDLIYFVHEDNAGLSAFVNAPAAEESRNARMIAVGILVPLSYGRLGRSWKHAGKLKEMANQLIADESKTQVLEDFWEEHKAHDGSAPDVENISPPDSPASITFKSIRTTTKRPKSQARNRSASDGTALLPPGHNLSAYHPAWSLPRLLETFGPLIFPIHRAALLRKRILITTHAPVEETCNFVYDLSVLSNIPLAVSGLLASTAPPQRLRPLFSIGVHDIPMLEDDLRASKAAATMPVSEDLEDLDETGRGWIACTTDSILAMKSSLYDVLITMPPPYSEEAAQKVWPKVESPKGVEMKATQRDLRRYRTLRWGLTHRVSPPTSPQTTRRASTGDQSSERPRVTSVSSRDGPMLDIPDTDSIVEPLSWSALAYSGFMWWASAGEQRLHSDEESEADEALLSGLSLGPPKHPASNKTRSVSSTSLKTDGAARQEMGIIAYFHRLTTQILTTLSDIVDVMDSDDEREDGERLLLNGRDEEDDDDVPAVYINSADVVRMGLDIWSPNDHAFVEEVAREYFGRRAQVDGGSVNVCGIRIC